MKFSKFFRIAIAGLTAAAMTVTMLPVYGMNSVKAAVAEDNLILHWNMTVGDDDKLIDLTGNGHSGNRINQTSVSKIEQVDVLNLEGGYVDIPQGTIGDEDTELTVNMLVKCTEIVKSSWMWCIGSSWQYNMYVSGSYSNQGNMHGAVTCVPSTGGDGWNYESAVDGTGGIVVNEWQNITVTYKDNGDFVFYKNGVRQGGITVADGKVDKSCSLQEIMGHNDQRDGLMGWSFYGLDGKGNNDPPFKGAVGDFRIYNHAMTADEVAELQAEIDEELENLKVNDFSVNDIDLTEEECLGTNTSKDAVTANLSLPKVTTVTVAGVTKDAQITGWASSNTAVIGSDGTVIRGLDDTEVTLTASVTLNGKTVEKSLIFTVPGSAEPEDIVKSAAEKLVIPNADDLRGSVTLPVKGEKAGVAIQWESSNESVISAKDHDGILAGIVNRQNTDTKVTLKATITYEEASAEKKIECTVRKKAEAPVLTDYLFAYFPYTSTKDERIYFGTSRDGLNFTALNDSKYVLESTLGTHGLRDPFIIRSHEGDKFYLIATDLTVAGITQDGENYPGQGWDQNQTNGSQSIMVWESNDLVNWSEQRMCRVAADDAGCTWAPEAYWDDELQQYVVFWASKLKSGGKQRVYYATTRDFYTFSEAQVWIEEAGSVIDTTVIKVGEYYYRYTKNEDGAANRFGTPSKRVYCERSKSLTSKDWELVHKNSLDVSGGQIEGPCIFKLNSDDVAHAKQIASLKGFTLEGDDVYCLAADKTGSTIFPGLSTDITSGSFYVLGTGKAETVNGTLLYSMPEPDASHGTIMPVTAEEYNNLMLKYDTEYAAAAAAIIEKAEKAAEKVTLDISSPVTSDLTLPTLEEDGIRLTWKSSDESVLAADGTVNRPLYQDGDATVVLTAVVTAAGNDVVADQVKTKDFTVTVAKKDPAAVTGIRLDRTELYLKAGDTAELKAAITPADAADKTVTWESSDAAVVSVSEGRVTAVKEGTATITASAANGVKAECQVTVQNDLIAVTGVTLNQTELSLKTGDTAELKATITPADAADKTVTWESSDAAVASVSEGRVTAVKEGTATITASAANGVKAECQITVRNNLIAVTEITLDQTELSLKIGDTAELKATITPADAADKTVAWESSDKTVASVSKGRVTAVKEGTATITASAANGVKAECQVTVRNNLIAVTGVALNQTELSLKAGQTATLTAAVAPEDATDKAIRWESSDAAVASVSDGIVTAVKEGTATITASAANGIKAECQVTVTEEQKAPDDSENTQKEIKITLSKKTITLGAKESATLTAAVTPAGIKQAVKWTSNKTSVATVKNGKITAKKKGTATITATAAGKTAACKVTVKAAPTKLTLNKKNITLKKGKTFQIKVKKMNPKNTLCTKFKYTSKKSKIAKVSSKGKITAVKKGSATITVTCGNNIKAKATIKVKVR